MTEPEGSTLRIGGRYRVEEQIGVGAMGAVWRATDELLNRPVAVKELLAVAPGTSPEAVEESRQRLLREGRIGARLQHAHVISMFDVVVHDERPWLVMEYLPSDSLASVVRQRGPLLPVQVAAIGRDVADGLAAAHLAGVVHRDVKPSNVLIGTDGRVKLTDFGVSRAVDDVQLTRTGLIAGTPAFLAPEIAQGRNPTAASDVFALGATLYAVVEGVPPFGLDDNAYALLHKVATERPRPPEHAGPLTPVLVRLLAVDPAERPSAAQARDLLATVAAGQEVSAAAPPTRVFAPATSRTPAAGPSTRPGLAVPANGGPSGGRRRLGPLVIGVLVALLVLGGGAAALALTRNGTTAAATPAVGTQGPTGAAAPTLPAPTTQVPTTQALTQSATTQASTTPAPSVSATASTTAGAAADPVGFLQRYYGLLPGNPEAAFALLTPNAQGQSGGHDAFVRFYAAMSAVTLQDPRPTGANVVSARIRFVKRDGTTSNEAYRFVMTTGADGGTLMASFAH